MCCSELAALLNFICWGLISAAVADAAARYTPQQPQKYRPPRQTSTQAARFAQIAVEAAVNSSTAQQWVLEYMGSSSARKHLHKSLQNLSNGELFERFVWEWEHLPIIHNAPIDMNDKDVYHNDTMPLQDDTILNLTLYNGYLQNPCQRFTVGADPPQLSLATDVYAGWYVNFFGMPPDAYPSLGTGAWTARQANECMLFDANNLQKKQSGNGLTYGGVTYVLNRATMRNRQFFEAWDAGCTALVRCGTSKLPTGKCVDIPLPGLGTTFGNWLHLVQPHELLMNAPFPPEFGPIQGCCDYSISDLFNRWWAGGAIFNKGMMKTNPYYETMAIGTVWVPEDILYIEVSYAGGDETFTWHARNAALWGTPVGEELRNFMKKNRRPIVWSNGNNSQMLIDPISNIEGGRITDADQRLFQDLWSKKLPWSTFVASMPKHLKLSWVSYNTKHVCEGAENNPENMIIGIDAHEECVYWVADSTPTRWELLIDGTCELSNSDRAIFASHSECLQQNRFECVTMFNNGTEKRYCQPSTAPTSFGSIGECEKQCHAQFTLDPTPQLNNSCTGAAGAARPLVRLLGSGLMEAIQWFQEALSLASVSLFFTSLHMLCLLLIVMSSIMR